MKENNARESGEFQIRFLVHSLPLVHPQKKKKLLFLYIYYRDARNDALPFTRL